MRNGIEDQIIDRRVEDLLNPSLKWGTNLMPTSGLDVTAKDGLMSNPPEEAPASVDNVYVSTRVETNPNEPPQLELHKRLLTSNVVLSAAIEKERLSELQLLQDGDDITAWIRDNLIILPKGDYALELGLAGDVTVQPEMKRIVYAVREAYEQFIVESHRDVGSEVKTLLSAERDEVLQQLLTASIEHNDLESADGSSEEQLKLAKLKVERFRELLKAVSAKVESIDEDTDQLDQLHLAVSGKWILRSATINGVTIERESTSSDDPFAPDQERQAKEVTDGPKTLTAAHRYQSAIFDAGHVSFVGPQGLSVERWSYVLDAETDPLGITMTQGGTSITGTLWQSKSQMVLSFATGDDPPETSADHRGPIFRYERDETDSAWLKKESIRVREIAMDLLLHGTSAQQATAVEFNDLADSLLRESDIREQVNAVSEQANEQRRLGKLQTAKSLDHDASILSLRVVEEIAMRLADQRLRENEKRVRQKVDQLNSQAAILRGEGRFAEAEVVEREVQKLLFDRDPDLQRVDQLKRRAAKARLEGKHPDAMLYDQQVEAVLQQVKTRYKQIDSPEVNSARR
ncbi:MAG: hypothetical protein H8E66_09135 [Planctomycetes bacterium]|nr:hypothetical protein [Planctomycetota bacterium]